MVNTTLTDPPIKPALILPFLMSRLPTVSERVLIPRQSEGTYRVRRRSEFQQFAGPAS